MYKKPGSGSTLERTYDDKLASTELRGLAQWLFLEVFVQKVFEKNLNLS